MLPPTQDRRPSTMSKMIVGAFYCSGNTCITSMPILTKPTPRPIFSVNSEGVVFNQWGLNPQSPRQIKYWLATAHPSFFAARCMHKRGYCRHAVSVCPSVCLSRSWIMSKWINISSKFFHHRVATPFWFFHTKRGGDIPTGTPLTGASNAGGV